MKTSEWIKKFPDRAISVSTLVVTCILSIWGIGLTFRSNTLNGQMLALTKHQDSLSKVQTEISNIQLAIFKRQDSTSVDMIHFVQLLGKTDTVISLSNSQLSINEKEQKIANRNAEYTKVSDESRFYATVKELKLKLFMPSEAFGAWDSKKIFPFLNEITTILSCQFNNPYLLHNIYMLQDWRNTYDSIDVFMNAAIFHPTEPSKLVNYDTSISNFEENKTYIHNQYMKCMQQIADLSMSTNAYVSIEMQYKNDKTKKGAPPTPKTYKAWMEQRKK